MGFFRPRILIAVLGVVFGAALVMAVFRMQVGAAATPVWPDLRPGDILFHQSVSVQSTAISLATGSPYTHCAVVLRGPDGSLQAFEAVGPVKWTPLRTWIENGTRFHYVVMRPRTTLSAAEINERLLPVAQSMEGRPYDPLFQWSDDAIYCSELIWKMFERGLGVTLSPLKTFRDYNLDATEVQALIHLRLGDTLDPDERVVAPSDLMNSDYLDRVYAHGMRR